MTKPGDGTRERLIVATKRLIQAHGYHGVGIAAILSASKSPRSSLYHHFPGGKPELARAAIQRLSHQITANFAYAADQKIPPRAHLEQLCREIVAWLQKTDWQEGALLSVLTTGPVSELAQAAEQAQQDARASYCAYLSQANIPDAENKTQVVLAALNGAVQSARTGHTPAPLNACATVLGPMLEPVLPST